MFCDVSEVNRTVICRRPSGPSKAMKLGSKAKDVDSFVDQLKSEGESEFIVFKMTFLFCQT